MGIPGHLTCLLRNLYAGQERTIRTRHGAMEWFKIRKEVYQGCILLPAYLTLCRVHIGKCQAGWIPSWNQDCWEKYQQPQICRWHHCNGRKWRGAKEPLDEGERGEWKKLAWNSTFKKWRSWHPVPSLRGKKRGKKQKQWQIFFISWAPKSLWVVTAAMKLKDAASWKESYNKLSVLKSKDITLLINFCLVKAIVFPIVMYECESWTLKKAEPLLKPH